MKKELKKEREVIASMFNGIAERYDLLNLMLSFGIDTLWRAKLVKFILAGKPSSILDIACGTGDLALIFGKRGVATIGADISANMLSVAWKKAEKRFDGEGGVGREGSTKRGEKPSFILASADDLPFDNESFDAVTISFGIRNFEKRAEALSEIIRVLRPGGSLAILEFASPKNTIWKALYGFYLKHFVPLVGRLVSGDKYAYRYLTDSIESFPKYESFCKEMREAGFDECRFRSLSGGIAALYTAYKK